MLKFTQGPSDEMQIIIALGIAAYLTAFPMVITLAVVCAEVMRRTQPDEPGAAQILAPVAGHLREGVAPAAPRREAEVATAV